MGWTDFIPGADIISSAITAGANMWSTSKTNKTNKRIAAQNNETAINLANTAHQREVADLQAAGLNPILSAGGQGAATPSLQQAEMKAPQFDSYAITDAIRAMAEVGKTEAEEENITQDTQIKKIQAETYSIEQRIKKVQAEIATATKQTEIDAKKQELKNLFANYDKTMQEVFKIQGGQIAEKGGTDLYNAGKAFVSGGKTEEQHWREINEYRERAKKFKEEQERLKKQYGDKWQTHYKLY